MLGDSSSLQGLHQPTPKHIALDYDPGPTIISILPGIWVYLKVQIVIM